MCVFFSGHPLCVWFEAEAKSKGKPLSFLGPSILTHTQIRTSPRLQGSLQPRDERLFVGKPLRCPDWAFLKLPRFGSPQGSWVLNDFLPAYLFAKEASSGDELGASYPWSFFSAETAGRRGGIRRGVARVGGGACDLQERVPRIEPDLAGWFERHLEVGAFRVCRPPSSLVLEGFHLKTNWSLIGKSASDLFPLVERAQISTYQSKSPWGSQPAHGSQLG